jgi:ATP-binding cassette subfamily C exporter for protease/lipase
MKNKNSELTNDIIKLMPQFKKAFLFSLASGLLTLAPIAYMREVYGPVLDSRSTETLIYVTILLIFVLLLNGVLENIRGKYLAIAALRLAELKSIRIFNAIFKATLQNNPPGATQALSNLNTIKNFFKSTAMMGIMEAPSALVFFILIFMIHPIMGIFSLTGAITMLLFGLLKERKVKPLIIESQRYSSICYGFITDISKNAVTVQAMNMKEALRKKWYVYFESEILSQAKASIEENSATTITKIVMIAQGSILLALTLWLSLTGVLSPQVGAYMIIAKLLGAKAVQPILILIKSMRQIELARESYDQLSQFLEKMPIPQKKLELPKPIGHLIVQKASINASNTKKVIVSDLNINLKPGKSLAIIGPSGSGKTSIAKMLAGIVKSSSGSVRLDGVDLYTWNKEEIGECIGFLPQEINLFEGSIKDNICRFSAPDENKLEKVIQLLNLNDVIKKQAEGLDTIINDIGSNLSGGEKQKIGIARAMYGTPCYVILDEPDANLDEDGIQDIISMMVNIKNENTTLIMITHNPVFLSKVDQILMIEGGKPKLYGASQKVIEHLNTKV